MLKKHLLRAVRLGVYMTDTVSKARSLLPSLTDEYITGKGSELISLRRGLITKEKFLDDAGAFIREKYGESGEVSGELLKEFEEYIFGYSRITPLLDDPEVSDIRVMGHRNVRVKKNGKRMDSGVFFSSEKEYRQFIDYIAAKNQVSVSNLSAIQRFTDSGSHPDFILRFTVSMPIVNTFDEPYLCIRKVPKSFPLLKDLVAKGMLHRAPGAGYLPVRLPAEAIHPERQLF